MVMGERRPTAAGNDDALAEPALAAEASPEATSDSAADTTGAVLEIRNLTTEFFTYDGVVQALHGVNIAIRKGETHGLVGETGCGKSVTAFSVTRLINDPPGRVVGGEILYRGSDLLWGLEKEASFRLTNQRAIRRLLSTIESATGQLSSGFASAANEASEPLGVITAAVEWLRPAFVGTNPEVARRLRLIRGACDQLAGLPDPTGTAASLIATVRHSTDGLAKAFQEGRVKVRRSFRRIRSATDRLSAIRGRSVAMIFQEPTQAMNPVFSVANQLSEVLLLHRGPAIIDEMMEATPDAAEVEPAIAELVTTASEGNREATVAAAARLGDVVHAPSAGTQAFYLVRDLGPMARDAGPEVAHVLRRLRLSPTQRRYLGHRKRLLEIRREIDQAHLAEMRERKSHGLTLRRLRARERLERWSHFYYGIWGVRGRIRHHLDDELFWRVVKRLEGVAIANPAQVAKGYPHELSGGMLQRVMISMALSPEPDVLIADEPTTALDVTIQAQILELMRDLKERIGTGILLITHDLAVIAEVADRVSVMYAGSIVEHGPVHEIFGRPLHPYAQGLLASIPRVDQPEKDLSSIPGSVPDLIRPPPGCRFHPRCPYAMPVCKETQPPTTLEGPEHTVACYLYKGPVVGD